MVSVSFLSLSSFWPKEHLQYAQLKLAESLGLSPPSSLPLSSYVSPSLYLFILGFSTLPLPASSVTLLTPFLSSLSPSRPPPSPCVTLLSPHGVLLLPPSLALLRRLPPFPAASLHLCIAVSVCQPSAE